MRQKVVVFGWRKYYNYEEFSETLERIFIQKGLEPSDIEIVEGGASGTDRMAERFSKEYVGMTHKQFKADWDTYGVSAGPLRNAEMADYGDWGVGFYNGSSKGTKNMINQMEKRQKEVCVVKI